VQELLLDSVIIISKYCADEVLPQSNIRYLMYALKFGAVGSSIPFWRQFRRSAPCSPQCRDTAWL